MSKPEEKESLLEVLRHLRLIDDVFMTEVFRNKDCVELLLRIILEKEDLEVETVKTQDTFNNFAGHSIRMDIHASDSKGNAYDIEVQRSNEGAAVERARYLSGALDASSLPKGSSYKELPDSYVIFITENDVFHAGYPRYHVERMVLETEQKFEDRAHIIYVNAAKQDDTPLGRLMHDLYCKVPADMHYETLRKQSAYYKETKEGEPSMCEALEKLIAKNRMDEKAATSATDIVNHVNALTRKKHSLEEACDMLDIAVSEYFAAKKLLEENTPE